jgi:ATP sulfurylase
LPQFAQPGLAINAAIGAHDNIKTQPENGNKYQPVNEVGILIYHLRIFKYCRICGILPENKKEPPGQHGRNKIANNVLNNL